MRSLIAALLLFGCGKKEEAPAATAPSAKGPAPLEWKKLDKMGLQIRVPADAEVVDMTADAPNVKLTSLACNVYVSTVTEAYTADFDKAVAEVEQDPGVKFKSFTKKEKTATGWHFEFQADGMIDPKPLHGVQIRSRIGDKSFECGDKAESAEKAQCTVEACLSLKML